MPGSIIKRSATNYAVKLYQGNGKYKWVSGFGSLKAATAYQASLASHPLHAANLGLYGSARERVGTYLQDWLRQQERRVAASTMRAKTLRTYRDFVTRYLVPDLGFIPLAKLGARAIEQQYGRLLERGLSTTTVRHVAMMLHKALNDAVRQELIGRNPCDHVERPPRSKGRADVWTEAETLLFLAQAQRTSRHYALYLLACTTGLRAGEVLALRWQDVDFERGTLTVMRSLSRPQGGGFAFETPKTPSSRRTVTLPAEVIAELKVLKRHQAEEFLRLGPAYRNHGLVFAQPNGLPLHAHNVAQRDFKRVIRRAGLRPVRFHDLRHMHLSQLIQRGVPLSVVAERAGHTSGAFTLKQYIHVMPGAQEQAARVASAILQAAPHLHLNLATMTGSGGSAAEG